MSINLNQPEVYVTPTYNAHLQAAAARSGKPYPYYKHTTLNELLQIQVDKTPQGTLPLSRYWVIGREGTVDKDLGGRVQAVATYHTLEHTGLFDLVPMAARPIENDLSSEERALLGLRREEEHNGEMLAVYYGRRIEDDGEPLTLQKLTYVNGVENREEYEPLKENLTPTKPILLPDGTNKVLNEFITTSDRVVCKLNAAQIQEVIDACERTLGFSELAQITEVAIVQGTDLTVTYTDHLGQPFAFKEIVGAQISNHCCKANGSLIGDDSFSMTFDIGVTDSLAIG